MNALAIERIDVGPEQLTAVVRVPPDAPMRTSSAPGLAVRALDLLPGLRRHTCENGTARGMAGELADTETPHLLEHVAFELMALSGSPRDLHGDTSWDFARDGRGVFRVSLGYDDDLVAIGALREGAEIVEWLLSSDARDRPDVEAAVARLRALRHKP